MAPLGQPALVKATRIHAATADTYQGSMSNHGSEHDLYVVVALGHLLPRMGAAGGITDQKDFHDLPISFGNRARQP
jgi:hypothetical protein